MNKIFLIAAVLIAGLGTASASTDDDILTCASIKDDAQRLTCFDAAAKMILARSTTMPENYILQRFKKTADK
jgi:hypothetical protein